MKALAFVLLVVVLLIAYFLVVGAVLAFLWNAILVDALALSLPTINLWVGVGLAILIGLVGGLFSRS